MSCKCRAETDSISVTLWSDGLLMRSASCLWTWRHGEPLACLQPQGLGPSPFPPSTQLLNKNPRLHPGRTRSLWGSAGLLFLQEPHGCCCLGLRALCKRSSEVLSSTSPKPGGPGACRELPPCEAPAALQRPLSLEQQLSFSLSLHCVISETMEQMQSGISRLSEHHPSPTPQSCVGHPFQEGLLDLPTRPKQGLASPSHPSPVCLWLCDPDLASSLDPTALCRQGVGASAVELRDEDMRIWE